MSSIYKQGIANDFKNSKLVFRGIDYGFEGYFSEARFKIGEAPTQSGEMWENGQVLFFKGAKFFYEVNQKSDTLTIRPLNRLNPEIDILQHNQKVYAQYRQKEDRKKPAPLNL